MAKMGHCILVIRGQCIPSIGAHNAWIPHLKEGRHLKLIKKVDNEIIDQAEFQLSGEKLFEGWFKLG
jgi:hypothetical protein